MKIAIVAPGGCAVDEDGVARAVERLTAAGCTVHNYYDAAAKFQRAWSSSTRPPPIRMCRW